MRVTRAVVLALVAALSVGPSIVPADARPAMTKARSTLTIVTPRGKRVFRIEIARTPAEQERGLMFRRRIPVGTGMIFPMDPPRIASFWMKNCPVPEDMIFVRANGTIARIAANTTPYSTDPVSSGEPVAAVFEIAGGEARRLGIAEGNKVSW